MEELGLADETVVGAVLEEAAVCSVVESIGDVVVDGLRSGGSILNLQKFCESHSFGSDRRIKFLKL